MLKYLYQVMEHNISKKRILILDSIGVTDRKSGFKTSILQAWPFTPPGKYVDNRLTTFGIPEVTLLHEYTIIDTEQDPPLRGSNDI